MSCPECGNKQPIEAMHLVFYPNATRAESDRLNYTESQCQMCGHKWNKYHSSTPTANGEEK